MVTTPAARLWLAISASTVREGPAQGPAPSGSAPGPVCPRPVPGAGRLLPWCLSSLITAAALGGSVTTQRWEDVEEPGGGKDRRTLTARAPRRKRTDTCCHHLPHTHLQWPPPAPLVSAQCLLPWPSPAASLFSSVALQNLFLSQQFQTTCFFSNHEILSST